MAHYKSKPSADLSLIHEKILNYDPKLLYIHIIYTLGHALYFKGCNNLQVNRLKHTNSTRGHIFINQCNGATISNFHITAPKISPNTDGINIHASTNIQENKVARNNQVKVNTLTQKPLMKEKFRNLTKFKVRVVLLKIESEGGTKENIEDVLQASKSTGEGNESASHPSPFDVPRQDKGKEGLEDLEQSEHGKEFESSEEDDSEFEESPTNSNRIPTPVDEGTVNKEKSTNEKEVHSTQNAIKKVHIMSERWLM
ncbi:hypothetical protein LguiA_028571 [Lonicera macranthoides]